MDESGHGSARRARARGALVLLAGIGVLSLPEAAATTAGLALLYTLAALAIVTGMMNLMGALRVRENARWLLPASIAVLGLGLAALAAPAGLASALTRALGGVIMGLGALTLLAAVRGGPAARSVVAAAPARPARPR